MHFFEPYGGLCRLFAPVYDNVFNSKVVVPYANNLKVICSPVENVRLNAIHVRQPCIAAKRGFWNVEATQ